MPRQEEQQATLKEQMKTAENILVTAAEFLCYPAQMFMRSGIGRKQILGWRVLIGPLTFPLVLLIVHLMHGDALKSLARQHANGGYLTAEDLAYVARLYPQHLMIWAMGLWVCIGMQLSINSREKRKGRPIHSYYEGDSNVLRFLIRLGMKPEAVKAIGEPFFLLALGVAVHNIELPAAVFCYVSAVSLFAYQAAIDSYRGKLRTQMTDAQIDAGFVGELQEMPPQAEDEGFHTASVPGGKK